MKVSMIKIIPLLLCAAITGCASSGDTGDLERYIQAVKDKPEGSLDPLPPVRTFDPYVYSATAMRSPFHLPISEIKVTKPKSDPTIKPDLTRTPEFLETFSIDSLSMVGTLEQNDSLWALMKDPSGGIHRITTGNFIGKNHGRIISTTSTQLDIVEIVADGLGGWVQRPRTIKLSEKE